MVAKRVIMSIKFGSDEGESCESARVFIGVKCSLLSTGLYPYKIEEIYGS